MSWLLDLLTRKNSRISEIVCIKLLLLIMMAHLAMWEVSVLATLTIVLDKELLL